MCWWPDQSLCPSVANGILGVNGERYWLPLQNSWIIVLLISSSSMPPLIAAAAISTAVSMWSPGCSGSGGCGSSCLVPALLVWMCLVVPCFFGLGPVLVLLKLNFLLGQNLCLPAVY